MLTINALQQLKIPANDLSVVLMAAQKPDLASFSNKKALFDLLEPIKILKVPFLGKKATRTASVETKHRTVKRVLAMLSAAKMSGQIK